MQGVWGLTALLALLLGAAVGAPPRIEYDPDVKLTTPELITKYGYPVETHSVTTADGYILSLHRIPGQGPPVLVQHGMLSSSADWVVSGPGRALAYLLADAGYDVWLGNARGNTYSRQHVTYTPKDKAFWDFSWHEMGVMDLPAVIDHILDKTKQEKIFYVGYSMGTTMFFVMASELPEYNNKVQAMVAMGPAAFLTASKSPLIRLLAPKAEALQEFLSMVGVNEFLPNNKFMQFLGQALCEDQARSQIICSNVIFLIAGYDSQELNTTLLPVLIGHTPAGGSTKTVVHFAQVARTGQFRQYDYGQERNLELYGSAEPPPYALARVTVPVATMWGLNDLLTPPEDVALTEQALPNLALSYEVPLPAFTHLDFIWAIHGKELVYDAAIQFLQQSSRA